MEQKKSHLDKLRDRWEVILIRLRRSQSKIYFLWFMEMFLFYGLLIGLGLFIDTTPRYHSTALQETLMFGSQRYELVEKAVDYDNGRLTLSLANQSLENEIELFDWEVKVEYLNGSEGKTKATLETGDNNYLYVYVSGLPDKWDVAKVTVTLIGEQASTSEEIKVSRQDTKGEKVVRAKPLEVTQAAITYAIDVREKEIKKHREKQEELSEQISQAEETIQRLKDNLEYETEGQKKESEAQITQQITNISQYELSIEEEDKQIEEYELQIQKLRIKLESIGK